MTQHALEPNHDMPAAFMPVSGQILNAVKQEYDVFERSEVKSEIILDTMGWDPEEELLGRLNELTGISPEKLAGTYLIMYHDYDLDTL